MIIDCIADLHGYEPTLAGGDLLIVAGDLTARDTVSEYQRVFTWLAVQKYRKIILIAGNHDNYLQRQKPDHPAPIEYLCDSGSEFEGLKIWGSPWTKTFVGMNPHCKAFTFDSEPELQEKWALIPDDTDILVTHSPPYGILDECPDSVGSPSLLKRSRSVNPKLHVFGHIHEGFGQKAPYFVNASYVNEHYRPVNKPIRIII